MVEHVTVLPFVLIFLCICETDGKERTSPHQRSQTFSQWLMAFWRQMYMVLKLKVKTQMSEIVIIQFCHYGRGK